MWALGHKEESWGPIFNMTVRATNLSAARNAVSELHRDVSEEMWSYLLAGENDGRPGRSITHLTNGVHTWSWLSPGMGVLFDRHSGGRAWREMVQEESAWSFIAWIIHEAELR